MGRTQRSLALGLLIGCGAGDSELVSSDVRIDRAGPEDVSEAEGVEMCINEAGAVYVVWADDRAGQYDVWMNISPDVGRTWLGGALLISHADSQAIEPDVACDGQHVYVVWEDDRDGEVDNHNIYLQSSSDGGSTWLERDLMLDDDAEGRGMSLGPQVVTGASNVHVAWSDSRNGAYDILVASSTDHGASFAEPVRVDDDEPGAAFSAHPQIALGEGVLHVVWEDSRGDGSAGNQDSDIHYGRSDDRGRTFAGQLRLDGGDGAGEHNSFSPKLGVEGETVYVAWHDGRNSNDGTVHDIYFNYSRDAGATWQNNADRADGDNPGFADSQAPVVAVHGGVATLAWSDARQIGYDIFARRHGIDGWLDDDAVRLDLGDSPGHHNSIYPVIAVGEPGVVVAWEDRRDDGNAEGYNDLYYNFRAPGGQDWLDDDLRIDNVESGSKFANDLSLELYNQRLCATWIDGRRGNADVYFHALKVGAESEYIEESAQSGPAE